MIVLLAAAAALAVFWMYRKWRKTKKYWADRNVPFLAPHPVLGNLTFLFKQNPGIYMRQIYNRDHRYLGLWWLWRPVLVINCPDVARRVLVRDGELFRNRFLSSGKKDPIGGLNLFLVNDPLWSSIRKRLSPSFSGSKLRFVYKHFVYKSQELVRRIKTEMENDQCVNLRVMYGDFTTDTVGMSAFGVRGDATLSGRSALRTVTKEFMKFNYLRGLGWACIFFFPELVDFFGFSFFPKSATNYFRKVFKQVVEERGGYDAHVGENKDFLDALRTLKQNCNRSNEEMPEDVLIAQAAAFLQGGVDTTASALTFCTYEIAHNPPYQEKIYNELLQIKDKILNSDLNAEDIQNMKHLNAAVKGERFALQNATCVLANIIVNYKIIPEPNSPLPAAVRIEEKSMLYVPAEDLYAIFVPRDV